MTGWVCTQLCIFNIICCSSYQLFNLFFFFFPLLVWVLLSVVLHVVGNHAEDQVLVSELERTLGLLGYHGGLISLPLVHEVHTNTHPY